MDRVFDGFVAHRAEFEEPGLPPEYPKERPLGLLGGMVVDRGTADAAVLKEDLALVARAAHGEDAALEPTLKV